MLSKLTIFILIKTHSQSLKTLDILPTIVIPIPHYEKGNRAMNSNQSRQILRFIRKATLMYENRASNLFLSW